MWGLSTARGRARAGGEQYARYAELKSGTTNGADARYGDSSGEACSARRAAHRGHRHEEPIPGVERASFGCAASTATCALDTVIGGNWVQYSTSSSEGDPDLLRERLIQTAASAVARLSG